MKKVLGLIIALSAVNVIAGDGGDYMALEVADRKIPITVQNKTSRDWDEETVGDFNRFYGTEFKADVL